MAGMKQFSRQAARRSQWKKKEKKKKGVTWQDVEHATGWHAKTAQQGTV